MKIKLLIADVDGTLVTQTKALTPATCDAIERLRAAGVLFTITSGRPPRGMAKLIAPLKLTAPIAAFNGAVYIKPDLKTVISQRTIPAAVARVAVDHMLAAGLDVWVYRGADWFVRDAAGLRVARESSTVGFAPVVVPDLHAVLDEGVKLVGISMDLALVARCEAELGARLGAEASAARSQPYYLDVTHPEANKGMVVREAARLLRISVDEVATIGDMLNDVPMLSIAGLSIAMGNASPEVQRVARHVTASNNDEGFAKAIDAFILGEPPLARTSLGLPPRARACLFGLDGVLAQTATLHTAAWKTLFDPYLRERARVAREPFVPFDPVRDYGNHFDGVKPLDGVRAFVISRGVELPEHTLRALVERKGAILDELLTHERVEPYEGSVRYLRAARAAGLRTAVVSTGTHCAAALHSAGLDDLFDAHVDAVVNAAQATDGTPAREAYFEAARALGVDFEDAVVFEDAPLGVEAGSSGHFGYVVGVDRGDGAAELRRHGADIVVSDLAVLLGPETETAATAAGM